MPRLNNENRIRILTMLDCVENEFIVTVATGRYQPFLAFKKPRIRLTETFDEMPRSGAPCMCNDRDA